MFFEQRPIVPVEFVVLAIGIVVAVLRPADFIAHKEHGQTKREHQHGEEILYLAVPQPLNFRIICWPLNAAVPASIVVRTITIILTVCLIVFSIVRNKVIERESVMTGYEVDALFGFAFLVAINVVAANKSIRKTLQGTFCPEKKTPYVIAEFAVPLFPAVPGKTPHLI